MIIYARRNVVLSSETTYILIYRKFLRPWLIYVNASTGSLVENIVRSGWKEDMEEQEQGVCFCW